MHKTIWEGLGDVALSEVCHCVKPQSPQHSQCSPLLALPLSASCLCWT